MALSFSEGSIGGDIASISLQGLEAFYGRLPASRLPRPTIRVLRNREARMELRWPRQ